MSTAMIAASQSILGGEKSKLRTFLWYAVPAGVCEALAMATIVPLFAAMFAADSAAFWQWLGLCGLCTAGYAVLYYLQAAKAFDVALSILQNLQRRIGDHVVTLPLGWFTAGRGGVLSLLATKGVMKLANVAAHMLTPLVVGVSAALTVAVIVLALQWQVGLALLVFVPFLWALNRWGLKIADGADATAHHSDAAVNNRLLEFARCQPVLRATGKATGYEPLLAASQDHQQNTKRLLWRQAGGMVIGQAAVQMVVALVLSLAVVLALGGTLDPVKTVTIVALTLRFSGPIMTALEMLTGIRAGMHNLHRIHAILATPTLPEPQQPQALPARAGGYGVTFRNVTFSYTDTPVIQSFSADAAPGSVTAIVGPSGSGKTTLTKLVARFHDVNAGQVTVGGVDVRHLATADLMASLSLVFQDVYLLDDTLAANIRLGRPDATDDEVQAVAEAAGVSEIAQRLPRGWQTRVGEGGAALSGGERQRVSIARALLKDAPVVLFDEATAALDPENERHVVRSMHQLRHNSTVLVIAHKLQTIVDADAIIMLTHDGAVADVGTHAELQDRCAQYRRYWRLREAARGWQLVS